MFYLPIWQWQGRWGGRQRDTDLFRVAGRLILLFTCGSHWEKVSIYTPALHLISGCPTASAPCVGDQGLFTPSSALTVCRAPAWVFWPSRARCALDCGHQQEISPSK